MQEKFVDQEVRIRMLELLAKDTRNLLRWILGVGITAIVIPILLHRFGLA